MTSIPVSILRPAAAGPFDATSPDYDFWSDAHCLAAERLDFVLSSQLPLTVFTGDSGAGKSTIVRKVVQATQDKRLIGVLCSAPSLSIAPVRAIFGAFGAAADPSMEEPALRAVFDRSLRAARDRHGLPTLIIDDAQRLDDVVLLRVLELSGAMQDSGDFLFRVVLVSDGLMDDRLKPLMQGNTGPAFVLAPMSRADTDDYVRHRLAVAGFKATPFSAGAFDEIFAFSQGNCQKVNALCACALSAFRGRRESLIDAALIRTSRESAGQLLRHAPKVVVRGTQSAAGLDTPGTRDKPRTRMGRYASRISGLKVRSASVASDPSGAKDPVLTWTAPVFQTTRTRNDAGATAPVNLYS